MFFLAFSAVSVGLIHSLAPGHWLPVVLMTQAKRWDKRMAVLGALVAASGHIVLSILIAVVGIGIGAKFLEQYEAQFEKYSGLALAVFGFGFALYSFFRHSRCVGHTHHGPEEGQYSKNRKAPFLFLLSLGFSPCLAALPVFAAAAPYGTFTVGVTLAFFALGVVLALVGATLSVCFGVMKLDHPLLEHYGDVLTGGVVCLMGLGLFIFG